MAIGSRPGRLNVSWRKPPLLWWKTLGVVVSKYEPIPVTKIESLDLRTEYLFPAVTKLVGHEYSKQDVLAACRAQNREYSLNKFQGRVDSSIRWDETLALEAIEAAYLEVTRQSVLPVTKGSSLSNGKFPQAMVDLAQLEQNDICGYCHIPFEQYGPKAVGDHCMPKSSGGLTVQWNCVAACPRCNAEKGDMKPHDFMRILLYRNSWGRKNGRVRAMAKALVTTEI